MDYHRPTKKSLGQHFLIDTYYVNELLRLISVRSDDHAIEIGPGSGCLTDHIIDVCKHLYVVELDKDCVDYLQSKYQGRDHFSLLHHDFLTLDCAVFPPRTYRWVGNLPYNVSVPILLRLIDLSDLVDDAVFMLQKEVALRCCALVGQKHYGRLGIVLQCVFNITYCFEIPPKSFSPPPKVDSAVIRMVVKDQPQYHYLRHPNFQTVLTLAFNQRRKMLRKIFCRHIHEDQWQQIGIDSQLRPEQVSSDGFYQIACAFQRESE